MSFWAVAMLEEDGGCERWGFGSHWTGKGRWGGGHFGVFIDDGAETLLDVADAVRIFSLETLWSTRIVGAYNNAGLAV